MTGILVMAEQDEQETVWIKPAEAAELMGVALRTVQHLCKTGEINCKQWGRSWMVDKASAEKFEARPKGWPKKAG